MKKRKIVILGSTGFLGREAIDIISKFKNFFEIIAIAGGSNYKVLAAQIKKAKPKLAVINNEQKFKDLKNLLGNTEKTKLLSGEKSLEYVAGLKEADIILICIGGIDALRPVIKAIESGKTIALANKESVVAAGEVLINLAKKYNSQIIPVDSEHSAIFQCINSRNADSVKKIILTGTGGPFRRLPKSSFNKITCKQVLEHPKWKMGAKITVDSATLMNKGLEIIEAKWLFNICIDKIEVVLHPEAVIHSMVEFLDNSVIAQLGFTSMKLPIMYALSYPETVNVGNLIKRLDFLKLGNLTFEKPDENKFLCLKLAKEASRLGGTYPACLNAANEKTVEFFLNNRISFLQIPIMIEKILEKHKNIKSPALNDILQVDKQTRKEVTELFKKGKK